MKPNLADLVLALYPYGYKEPKSPIVQAAVSAAMRGATVFKRVENFSATGVPIRLGWNTP